MGEHRVSLEFRRTIAKCISVSILLWRDAAPRCKFPPIRELVSTELGRLLMDPSVLRAVPGLRASLDVGGVTALIHKNPWEVNPREMVTAIIKALSPHQQELLSMLIDERGHKDICLDLLRNRRSLQSCSQSTVDKTAEEVCKTLGITDDCEHERVAKAYDDVFLELQKV